MMETFSMDAYSLLMRLVCFTVITRMLLLILPGKKYYVYMKLLIGFCIMTLTISYLNQIISVGKFSENLELIIPDFEELSQNDEIIKYAKTADKLALSTLEENIKTELNKSTSEEKECIDAVKIDICENVNSVDYGKITAVDIEISEYVDKTVNTVVNNSIVRQEEKKQDIIRQQYIKNYVVSMLGIEEDVIKIVR